jgi:NAD(P) transhydrogenase subunit alpha
VKIGIPKERRPSEKRVAASPETVRKLTAMGIDLLVEEEAGQASFFPDRFYQEAGASIVSDAGALFREADVVLKVQRPLVEPLLEVDEMALLRPGQTLIAMMEALVNRDQVKVYAEKKVTAMALELLPRITRAQSMDVLSSQSNLAGYKAVIDASYHFGKLFPMMMTAAGTIAPARVLVLGAGVAGLQAVATAKRLGAIVSAFDVRPVAKEQVESLGAKFVEVASDEVESAETAGGYAREMSEEYKKKQAELIHDTAKKSDIIITTALIPGKPAPVLVTEEMVRDMKPGSVIFDLAGPAGGNCPLCVLDQVVVVHGVTIISYENIPSRVPMDASILYARNVFNFLVPMIDKETKALRIDTQDEIIRGTLLTHEGRIVHQAFNP